MLHWDPHCRGNCPDAKAGDGFTNIASHALLSVECPRCIQKASFKKDVIDQFEMVFRTGKRVARHKQPPLAQAGIPLLEELPPDTIVAKYTTGSIDASTMIANLQEGTDVARQWLSDLLRVSRDLLARETRRETK